MSQEQVGYKKNYGAWAGDPKGQAPDLKRCCVSVWSREWSREFQCTKPRGYGPEGAYCKQHDPEVVKGRQAKSAARGITKWNERRYEFYGKTFFKALQEIADGHNDARGLAQEVIEKFRAGEHK